MPCSSSQPIPLPTVSNASQAGHLPPKHGTLAPLSVSAAPQLPSHIGLIQIHLAALLAGFTGLFGKYLALSPALIVIGRTAFGCLALWLATRLWHIPLQLRNRRDLAGLIFAGAVLAFHWFSFFKAIQLTSVAVGVLAFSSFPLFTTLLEPLMFGEHFRAIDLLLVMLVIGGLLLVTPSFNMGDHMTQGLLWGIASGFAYAILSLLSRANVAHYPAQSIAFYQQFFACLCSLPTLLFAPLALHPLDLALLVALGVIFTALAQSLFISSLRHIRAHTASVVIGLEPVYSIILAAWLLGEIPPAKTLAGGVLICMAVFGASLLPRRDPPR